MKDPRYRGITLQAEPSSLRCVVEMKDQRKPLPPACLCTAACPAAKNREKNTRAYIAEDKVRIKNKRILEHTTSFTQETTSWICGRPRVFQLECEALRLKRSEETADKAVKERVSGRIRTSLQGWKGKRAVETYQKRRGGGRLLIIT